MESVEHSLRLKDGRTLAYHTFTFPDVETETEEKKATQEGTTTDSQYHPVLYFHGFPGCGLEGGFCARSVAREGGRLYAIDRPGMGKSSSPYNNVSKDATAEGVNVDVTDNDNAYSNLETFVDNVWELVEDQEWEEFSVIGVSGGGPYALALLASYLRRSQLKRPSKSKIETNETRVPNTARLRNVCLVGACCITAGVDGMMKGLLKMAELVEKAPTSRWNRFQLGAACASMGMSFNYLIPIIPSSLTMYLNSFATKDLPAPDREWMSDENNVCSYMSCIRWVMAQGAYPGVYDDAMIILKKGGHPHEEVLRKEYGGHDSESESECETDQDAHKDATAQDDHNSPLPAVGIFQGGLDAQVPPSHARYLHESIFYKRSSFFLKEDLGHVSLVAGSSDEYAAFATRSRNA